MAKVEKRHPDFECTEYDYGDLPHRDYNGCINATLKFTDNIELYVYFEFKEFLDYHKRKKTNLQRVVENLYSQMRGWGSRYFELIEKIQGVDDIDLFELFKEFIELTNDELTEDYEFRVQRLEELRKNKPTPQVQPEKKEETPPPPPVEKAEVQPVEEEEDTESLYMKDRTKLDKILNETSDDIYEHLKANFFPKMEYFQRRYPTKWKKMNEYIEEVLEEFEEHLLENLLPSHDEKEYHEYEIKYNSEKADMSDDDEPPTAR